VLVRFEQGITARLYLDASQAMSGGKRIVFVDGGPENYNAAVDEVLCFVAEQIGLFPDARMSRML